MPKEDVEPSFPALNFVEGLELYDPKVRVYYKDQKTGKAVRLGDVLNYRALYKKFPDFGDIPVVFINERINVAGAATGIPGSGLKNQFEEVPLYGVKEVDNTSGAIFRDEQGGLMINIGVLEETAYQRNKASGLQKTSSQAWTASKALHSIFIHEIQHILDSIDDVDAGEIRAGWAEEGMSFKPLLNPEVWPRNKESRQESYTKYGTSIGDHTNVVKGKSYLDKQPQKEIIIEGKKVESPF